MRELKRRHLLPLVGLALVTVLASACSPPATQNTQNQGSSGGSSNVPEQLQKVYDAVNGLTGEQRRQKLIELAKAEGGEVTFYTSTAPDDINPVVDAFESSTGLKVNLYSASGATMVQRAIQEHAANRVAADVIQAGVAQEQVVKDEGMLADLQTPIAQDILEAGRGDQWLAPYVVASVVGWNTNNVSPQEAPKNWKDLLTRFKGKIAFNASDWDWFTTIVKEHLVGEEGMTEDQAVDLFRQAVSGSIVENDHTLGSQLLASGEIDAYPVLFHHYIGRLTEQNAPIAWQPAVEPIVIAPVVAGIANTTKRPASALLLIEFELTDGQKILGENGRTVANSNYEGGLPEGQVRALAGLNEATLGEAESKRWEDLWADILQGAGKEMKS
jgi:iron(III) transport system substrate-binding protein